MRFSKLTLTAFGHFTNYEFTLPDNRPFHIFYGLNEAGKSTILRAVTDFLYGFPHQSPDVYFHTASDLRIQASVKDTTGNEHILIRRKGRKNTLFDPDGKTCDDLLQTVLNNIDKNRFAMMFGMDHSSLRKGGENILKGGGAVGESLFEAASGISGLRDLFRRLEEEAGKLYRPQGSRMAINAKLNEYKEAKAKIIHASLRPTDWQERERAYHEEERQITTLRKTISQLHISKARWERLQKTLPILAGRNELIHQATKIGDVLELPPTFQEERLDLLKARTKTILDQEKAQQDLRTLRERINDIHIPPQLLDHANHVAGLQERLDTYRTYLKEIPALQGEVEELRRSATAILRELKPSLTTLADAQTLRLPLHLRKEIRSLGADYTSLKEKLASTQARVNDYQLDQEKLRLDKEKIGSIPDTAELKELTERVQKQGDPERDLLQTRADAEALRSQIVKEIAVLGLWTGTSEECEQLTLPLPETVRRFEQEFKSLQDALLKTDESIAKEETDITTAERNINALQSSGEIPTDDILTTVRNRRQAGWQLIRRSWLEGNPDTEAEKAFDPENPLDIAYESSVTAADNAADALRREAARVADKSSCLQSIARSRHEINLLREKRTDIEARLKEANARWLKAWQNAGIIPLTPDEMRAWLERHQTVTSNIKELNKLLSRAGNLESRIDTSIMELRTALAGLTVSTSEQTLSGLISRAREVYTATDKNRTLLQTLDNSLAETEIKLKKARQDYSQAQDNLQLWQQKWSSAMAQSALPADTAIEAAAAFLDKLEELFTSLDTAADREHQIQKKQEYTADFAAKAASLTKTLAPELIDTPSDIAVSRLQSLVAQANLDTTKLSGLKEQLNNAETALGKAEESIRDINRRFDALKKQAGCSEEAEMERIEANSRKLTDIKDKLNQINKQLLFAGSGQSLTELVAEAEGADGDTVQSNLIQLDNELKTRDEERSSLEQQFGVTKKAYLELLAGADSTALESAEAAQSIIADLRSSTEEYLQLRLAAIVLLKAIDRYREENQNPVIRRSGELFSELTLNSFASLKVDFDENDKPILLGVRASGNTVKMEGMSDGSRDQLYLALRLASIERYLASHEPVPLILDDILVNFDDRRAAATLRVLAALAGKTQILFFTHHERLVQLAREVVPEGLLCEHHLTM
ncbi:MAG: Chromosome partition protein Smc [Dehalococcoidia bacterium]|nr:Chromosome partition protein Smc [Bacillota bacterium]